MGQQNDDAAFDQLSDEDLAAIIIGEISALETQGVRMPAGWHDAPVSLRDLDALLESALRQLKALHR